MSDLVNERYLSATEALDYGLIDTVKDRGQRRRLPSSQLQRRTLSPAQGTVRSDNQGPNIIAITRWPQPRAVSHSGKHTEDRPQ